MTILTVGSENSHDECRAKFGGQHNYISTQGQEIEEKLFSEIDVVFDFTIADFPHQMEVYGNHPKLTVFLNTTLKNLQELGSHVDHKLSASVFGFCGLPTFLNRPVLETSLYKEFDGNKLMTICEQLKTEYVTVEDSVGLVTPRVICMIINEAYFTVEEGTATREDIDLAMKLGTNYPYGPFEWAQKIGIRNVYKVLRAVYEDTKDERYKICPLLRKESLLPIDSF